MSVKTERIYAPSGKKPFPTVKNGCFLLVWITSLIDFVKVDQLSYRVKE
jgi:hypothetical protein